MPAYWSQGGYTYWSFWIEGETIAERENLLKLKLQEVRRDANSFHHKGVGYRIVDIKVDRRKNRIDLQVKLEDTQSNNKKRRKRS